jgi:hypothetical protein
VILNHKRVGLLGVPAERLRVALGVLEWTDESLAWLEADYQRHVAPLLSDVVSGIFDGRYIPRRLYRTTVLAAAGEALCTETAFLDRACGRGVSDDPCPLHGSPAPIRTLCRAGGIPTWGWDEPSLWKDVQKDREKIRLARLGI